MRGGSRSGSYFFVLDAFMASMILVVTLAIVFNLFTTPRPTEQSLSYAQDYLGFLTTTQTRDYRSQVVSDLSLTSSRHTLAEDTLYLHNASRAANVTALLAATAESLPSTIALNVSIKSGPAGGGVQLYSRNLAEISEKRTHLVARRVVYSLINDTAIYGPVVFQVEVWA